MDTLGKPWIPRVHLPEASGIALIPILFFARQKNLGDALLEISQYPPVETE